MKRVFLAGTLMLSMFAGISNAALISAGTVTGTGTFFNSASLINDGVLPVEATGWTQPTNVYWNGTVPKFTLDFGGLYNIDDVLVSADLNDSYEVAYSTDLLSWANLFTIDIADGEINPYGMDTMSTNSANTEYEAGIEFSSVQARYLRIEATGGDSSYSIGELQAFGSAAASVPEPSILAIFGLGIAGLGFVRRRRQT